MDMRGNKRRSDQREEGRERGEDERKREREKKRGVLFSTTFHTSEAKQRYSQVKLSSNLANTTRSTYRGPHTPIHHSCYDNGKIETHSIQHVLKNTVGVEGSAKNLHLDCGAT